MNDSPLVRTKISQTACSIAAALLFLTLAIPAMAYNYSLSAPTLWSPQERARYEKESEPVKKPELTVEKRKAPIKKAKVQLKKLPAKKIPVKKDQIFVKDGVSYREVIVQKGDSLARIARKYRKSNSSYQDVLTFNGFEPSHVFHSGDVIKVPITAKKAEKQADPVKPPQKAALVTTRPTTVKPVAKPIVASSPRKKPAPVKKNLPAGKAISKPAAVAVQETVPAKAVLAQPVIFSLGSSAKQKEHRAPEIAVLKQKPAEVAPAAKADAETTQSNSGAAATGQKLFELAVKAYRQDDCLTAVKLFGKFLADNSDSILAPDASLYNADCYLKLSDR